MRTSLKLAVAVGATLAATSSAFALNPAQTAAASVKLVVAGASAYRDTFALELPSIAQGGVVDRYVASSGQGDFRVYSFTANANSGLANGTTVAIYYRSEGGSVYGVGPIAKGTQILRLLVDNNCSLTGTNEYTCTVAGFNLTGDTFTSGHLVKDTVQLGVSDVEPALFSNEANWPLGTVLGSVVTEDQLTNIDSVVPGNGVTFGVYVNSGLGVTNLSKQTITTIFSGLYSDWNQVPLANGSGFVSSTSKPIKLCRREFGSGTHATANVFFLGAGCSAASYSFAGTPDTYGSTGALMACVAGDAGGIGYASLNTVPGTSLIQIDGKTASKYTSAQGLYDYWFENTFNSRTSVLNPSSPAGILAATLVARMQDPATIAAGSANTFALPIVASPVIPVPGTGTPVSIGYRSGNSCYLPQGQN